MTPEDSWREHVDRELCHLREHLELAIKRESDLWRADAAATEKARVLQSQKDVQHFEALNHENARVLAAGLLSVSAEKYEADRKGDQMAMELAAVALRNAKAEMDAKLSTLRDQVRTDTDTRTGQAKGEAIAAAERAKLIGYIGIGIAVVSMLLKFLPLGGAP